MWLVKWSLSLGLKSQTKHKVWFLIFWWRWRDSTLARTTRSVIRGSDRYQRSFSTASYFESHRSKNLKPNTRFDFWFLVEMKGFEPLTPCLQGRCSPSWATPPWVGSLIFRFTGETFHLPGVSIELSSRTVARKVFSPLQSLTSVFGMGTGGPSSFRTLTSYSKNALVLWKLNNKFISSLSRHRIRYTSFDL